MKLTYRDSGVDTKEGQRAVGLMRKDVESTFDKNVLTGLGSFGGLYELPLGTMKNPVLVSGTDGVGTKLKLAFMLDRHDTVGVDCVAMCANDVICQGGKPMFFLDYIATGSVKAEKIGDIVRGIAEGCKMAGCALIGGETAEMPGFYDEDEYDMAGFCVGLVDKEAVITGEKIEEGDAIVGIGSSGLHSNGFSLARKLFFEERGMNPEDHVDQLDEPLGEALLRPTKIYVDAVNKVSEECRINGLVHITGGGFFENVPRVLPQGLACKFDVESWDRPAIFDLIESYGDVTAHEMFSTFNMGIGMMIFLPREDAKRAVERCYLAGESAWIIGQVVPAEGSGEKDLVILGE